VSRYRRLADERSDKNDFSSALAFLHSAKQIDFNLDVIVDIADAYADMGNLELSNKFWFLYLDRAPKDKVALAYEELAINFFYLDNYWAASYYFHQKLSVDGYISKDGLSQEIIDFFSGEEQRKTAYRIVYPREKANFDYEIKKAKHFMAISEFAEAEKSYSKIPKDCMSEETLGDYSICLFMSEKFDDAEQICRYSLEKYGESVTAYCNLSTIYDMKEDFSNSEYYYQKALEQRKSENSESYRIATCAIEREDHQTAADCLKDILDDRPYEISMRYFYGLALANLGNYTHAVKELKEASFLNPDDFVVDFYLGYVLSLEKGESDKLNLLPFKYVKELPECIVKDYEKQIRSLASSPEKVALAIKKKSVKSVIDWALLHGSSEIMRNAVFILSLSDGEYAMRKIKSALLDTEGREELKQVLIYVLIMKGVKEKFGVVAGSFFLKLKPQRLLAEKDVAGALLVSSYALCMSKIVFYDVDDTDKIAKACDGVYKKFRGKITHEDASNEELAAFILSIAKTKRFKKESDVMRLFSISKDKYELLKKLYKGEKND
jgi:tetratricopeptide (TPR) repeat protein